MSGWSTWRSRHWQSPVTLAWLLDDWPMLDYRRWGHGLICGSQQALRAWLAPSMSA